MPADLRSFVSRRRIMAAFGEEDSHLMAVACLTVPRLRERSQNRMSEEGRPVKLVPGRRILGFLVIVFVVVYAVMVVEDHQHGALNGIDTCIAILAGLSFLVPALSRVAILQTKWKGWRRYRLSLTIFVVMICLVAAIVGIVVAVHTTGTNWIKSVTGFEAYFAFMASLLLLDDLDEVSIGRRRSLPTQE